MKIRDPALRVFSAFLIIISMLSSCSTTANVSKNGVSTTSTADTCDFVPFTLYYERNPSVPLYLEGIAVTKETMHQIMNNSGWEIQLLQKSLVLPNEIRHDYLEINLDAVLEESCSYTIWGLFRPYSMYAFNNVFLRSGDTLSLYSPNEKDIFLTVEHSDGETRDYLAVLVFIA